MTAATGIVDLAARRCSDRGVHDRLQWRSAETGEDGGDADRGGEVAAWDRPGRNGHAFKGVRHPRRLAHGIDVPNALRQAGPGGNEEADRWAALQLFSNSKITAGIELSMGKIAKG
jgi:hypothetical protein